MSTALNLPGAANAAKLITDGSVKASLGSWSLSEKDKAVLLGPNGNDWHNFSKWHLGTDPNVSSTNVSHYLYPIGKDGKVHRSALASASVKGAAAKDWPIVEKAIALIHRVDGSMDGPKA